MLQKMKRSILLLILMSFFVSTYFAQKQQIGLSIGYGLNFYDDAYQGWRTPFANYSVPNYFISGLNYFYTPKHAIFRFKSSLNYNSRFIHSSQLDYIEIPTGFDFVIGKRFNVILGTAFSFSYLIYYKNIYDKDFEKSKNLFQMRCEINAGFGFALNKKWEINLIYQRNFDIIPIYTAKEYSVSGAESDVYIYGCDVFIGFKLIKTI